MIFRIFRAGKRYEANEVRQCKLQENNRILPFSPSAALASKLHKTLTQGKVLSVSQRHGTTSLFVGLRTVPGFHPALSGASNMAFQHPGERRQGYAGSRETSDMELLLGQLWRKKDKLENACKTPSSEGPPRAPGKGAIHASHDEVFARSDVGSLWF